jgi:hypothetical protein
LSTSGMGGKSSGSWWSIPIPWASGRGAWANLVVPYLEACRHALDRPATGKTYRRDEIAGLAGELARRLDPAWIASPAAGGPLHERFTRARQAIGSPR